jgi:hypothetical protein
MTDLLTLLSVKGERPGGDLEVTGSAVLKVLAGDRTARFAISSSVIHQLNGTHQLRPNFGKNLHK